MTSKKFRIFATCHIGDAGFNRLREKGYELEVYPGPEAPPKSLIVEKVRSGVDALITTLRDPIDAEVFAAGKGTLKVVAQDAVGFDNINRNDANRYKIPFTNTPNVLTDATAEFAFFILGAVARKLWPSEKLVRENKWGSWHPFLPFLGDEVGGKTIAVIGTGRIGQALIKKCVGLEMNVLAYDPAYQDHKFVAAIQQLMDTAHSSGLYGEKRWIKYVSLESALSQADFVSLHVPLVRPEEPGMPTYHLINETTLKLMRKDAYLINTSRGPVAALRSTYSKRSRFHRTLRCAILRLKTVAVCFITLPAARGSRACPPILTKAWQEDASRVCLMCWKGITTATSRRCRSS